MFQKLQGKNTHHRIGFTVQIVSPPIKQEFRETTRRGFNPTYSSLIKNVPKKDKEDVDVLILITKKIREE